MNSILPKALLALIEELGSLPGVGERTAERYAYALLRRDTHVSKKLAEAIASLHERVDYCPKTFALIEKGQGLSPLYTGADRDKTLVAVVEEPLDVVALERTGQFKGTYHVLGGVISPIDGIGPDQLADVSQRIERARVDSLNAQRDQERRMLELERAVQELNLVKRQVRGARDLNILSDAVRSGKAQPAP